MNASSTTYIELLLREPTKQRSHFRQCSKITLLRQRPTSILCSLALTGVIKPSEQLRVQKGKWHRIENGCTSFRSLMMKSNKTTTTTKTTKMDVCTLYVHIMQNTYVDTMYIVHGKYRLYVETARFLVVWCDY